MRNKVIINGIGQMGRRQSDMTAKPRRPFSGITRVHRVANHPTIEDLGNKGREDGE